MDGNDVVAGHERGDERADRHHVGAIAVGQGTHHDRPRDVMLLAGKRSSLGRTEAGVTRYRASASIARSGASANSQQSDACCSSVSVGRPPPGAPVGGAATGTGDACAAGNGSALRSGSSSAVDVPERSCRGAGRAASVGMGEVGATGAHGEDAAQAHGGDSACQLRMSHQLGASSRMLASRSDEDRPRFMTSPADSNPFHLTVDGFPADHFRVESFVGHEVISLPYSFEVVATVETPSDEELERLALGQRAVFTWDVGKGERAVYGVVAAVRLAEVHDAGTRSVQYHLRVVPRLWLLKRRRRTRIFQGLRVTEIVDAVLREAGIATRWQILRDYPVRAYCTQYEESDLHFIKRLCAEAGVYFYFPLGPSVDAAAAAELLVPGDTVIFADDASFYPPIAGDDPSALAATPSPAGATAAAGDTPTLYFMSMQDTAGSHLDKVTHFSPRTVVKATSAMYRDYDPQRPQARISSAAGSTAPDPAPDPAGGAVPGPLPLEVYDHHGKFLFPSWSFDQDEAALTLRQKRRRASTAHGEGGCPDLSPGHRFALADHSAMHLDRAYALTSVDHHGFARPSATSKQKIYWNVFTCVPAEVTIVPPRPARKSVQVALTATVVGPPGEEIHVDAMGQIKVQFHWDREGGADDKSSCWIRTMHPWAGAGWGVQFIPRVGMEVVVVFDGGDTDKPMVLGSVYNGTHPPPFMLPGDKTRSGIRTQTSPGGGGSNELSFEDARAKEQIYVHAQRDLDEVVERNHTLLVRGDERLRVLGSRMDIVEEDVIARVARNVEEHVGGDRKGQVEGNRVDVVTGNSDERVSGMLVTRVEGKERRSVQKNADLEYADDLTVRVRGCMTTLVGRHDAKRSWATHAEGNAKLSSMVGTEVSSEGELLLRVGKSSIRITSEKIEIDSPAVTVKGKGGGLSADDDGLRLSSKGDAQVLVDKKLVLKIKDGASLSMEKEVKVDGTQILLNSPDDAKDPPPKPPEPPTKVVFRDHEGRPLKHRRFLVVMGDGGEVSGMTDKDGHAEVDLKSGGKVTFPDLSKAR